MTEQKLPQEQNLIPAPPTIFAKEWAILANTYEYIREAGRGKTGVAYQIRDRKNKISFCLKTVAEEITAKKEVDRVRTTLQKEYDILTSLENRCLPQIFAFDFKATRPYYICTLHPGITIHKFITTGAKLTRDEAIFATTSLISVLEYLHKNGRTHNDLHLNNVLIDASVLQHGIMLIDFGSGHRESASSEDTEVRGNIHFMPNRLKGMRDRLVHREEAVGAFKASDFVALGHLLAAVQDAFFNDLSLTQKAALDAFCTRLIAGEYTTWSDVKNRFSGVIEPFRHIEALRNSFINDQGLHEAIPLPVYSRVPVGPVWLAAINSEKFQALRRIKQLAFCDWFFPGARHSRFEHSLGVFNLMHSALEHLSAYSEVRDLYDESDLKGALFAALMHDVGHYPLAHLMEQYAASRYSEDDEILNETSHWRQSLFIIETEGFCESIFPPGTVEKVREAAIATLNGNNGVISDLLDGPTDIDKMDYVRRDSLHCGVRFGEGLDPERLLSAIRLSPEGKLSIAASGINAFEGFLILQNQMLGEVYWHEYTRAIISMFHVAVAHIVRDDRNAFLNLIQTLKTCPSEEDALSKVLLPRLSRIAKREQKPTLNGLLNLHIKPDFRSIYRCIKTYTRADKAAPKRRVSIYGALVTAASRLTGSQLPIDWRNARLLRRAFLDAIKGLKIEAADHDVIVDVPTGKASHRTVEVLLDSGEVVPITALSHIQQTLFTEPAIFVSPVRVFVSPRIHARVNALAERVLLAAEDNFYSAEKSQTDQDTMVG